VKYCIIFIITIIFSFFSCGGIPKLNPVLSIPPQDKEIRNETILSSAPDFEPPLPEEFPAKESSKELSMEDSNSIDTEESSYEEKTAEFDITEETDGVFHEQHEIAVTEPEKPEPLSDAAQAPMIDEPQFIPQIAEVAPEPPVQIQAETPDILLPEPETLPVQTQSVQSLTQPLAQTQTLPQTQTQPPAQTQTQPPVQVQAPVQTALPVQAPPALASAEERPLTVRENPPVAADIFRLDTSKDEPVTPFQTVLVPQNETIVFSRIVHAVVGQIIEIPFRGTGWIYTGEAASKRGIAYESSRSDPEGQSLIFRVEDTGTYALKFFKRDLLRDYILNDYVQVIAGEAPVSSGAGWFNPPVDRGMVVAQPRWPTVLEESEIQRGGGSRPAAEAPATASDRGTVSSQGIQGAAQTRGTGSAVQQTNQPPVASSVLPQAAAPQVVEASLPPDVILQRAKDAFNGGNVPSAIALLDQYGELYHSDTDELYWLYGQFYEANSPSRNILLSLDYYRRLVREYPQSGRYNSARSRIAYLERYYINIQ